MRSIWLEYGRAIKQEVEGNEVPNTGDVDHCGIVMQLTSVRVRCYGKKMKRPDQGVNDDQGEEVS